MVDPAGVVEADASATIASGAKPAVGLTLSAAIGATGSTASTVAPAVEDIPALFDTLTVITYLPVARYSWFAT
jgi:hypothetical protein